MILPQQETGVKLSDGHNTVNPKAAKQKAGTINSGSTNLTGSATTTTIATEQQAQRCPRCDSLNTKFCYYNNYSLSQPRHFCKNCRRYWTKGGALRNVPVGGGCRKNKRLKHRDPSCLAALTDPDSIAGASNLFSSMGIPGFGASTSSLIQELANEGHRLAFSSRLGAQMLDNRLSTDNEYRLHHHHHHHHHPSTSSAEFFTLGAAAASLMGSFDQPASFPALPYTKGDPQSLLFNPHQGSELTPFFDPIASPTPLTPTLDHLSSFTTAGLPLINCATSLTNTATMDPAQLSLIHHMPMSVIEASHEDQQVMQENSAGGNEVNQEGQIDANMQDDIRRSTGKSVMASLSDWGQQITGTAPSANATDSCSFYGTPQLGCTGNDQNGLWSATWPEMHAALAGPAGAMLH